MKYQFIPEHNIIVSDERAKEGSNFNFAINKIEKLSRDYEEHSSEWNFCRKIIAGIPELPQIDYNGFKEKLGVVDIDKLAEKRFPLVKDYRKVFIIGFKVAQSLNKKKYTEEELRSLVRSVTEFMSHNEPEEFDDWFEKKLLRLSQPKPIDVELEMDFVHTDHVVGGFEYFPKIINNSVKIIKA